jgi:cytochrome c peroxidase
VAVAIPNQKGIEKHPIDFDVTQGGRTFVDPDGDPLSYSMSFGSEKIDGIRLEGTRIVGIPANSGKATIGIWATDGSGQYASWLFEMNIAPNAAPSAATSYADVIVPIGTPVDIAAAAVGALFQDADRDSLTFEFSTRGFPGLAVNGDRLQGSLASAGAVEVTVTARDGFGGEGITKFLVASPGPEPGAPTLPASSHVYEDAQMAMPELLRLWLGIDPGILPVPTTNLPTNSGATLGRVLFYDKRLSITNTVACATCHKPDQGFATNNRFDTGVLGIPLKRNSMTITNARTNGNNAWFSDMRAGSLHAVAEEALTTADEMGSNLPLVESKLKATAFYGPLFAAAFGSAEITGDRVLLALEQYLRSVLSYRSRFDHVCIPMSLASAVDCTSGFTAQELRGQELFESNPDVDCVRCHGRWSMNNIWHANNGIDDVVTDPGVLDLDLRRDGTLGIFRAPSLRNIARTAPYMHDGRFATLRDVIDHYDHGIKVSQNLDGFLGDRVWGTVQRMDLSEADKVALEAFLETFTDVDMMTDPKFSDPFQ